MNRQDIYDKVRAHLLSMPGPSARPAPSEGSPPFCLYLSPGGRKCAIGILIPDGHPAQESLGDVMELLNNYPDLGDLWGIDGWEVDHYAPEEYDDVTFLYELQLVHDGGGEGLGVDHHWGPEGLNEAGRAALDEVADNWGLAIRYTDVTAPGIASPRLHDVDGR